VRPSAQTAAESEDYTYFSADVSISATGDMGVSKVPSLTRRVTYKVERHRGPDGMWATTFTLTPPTAPMSGAASKRRKDVRRIEATHRGTIRGYDAAGKLVSYEAPNDSILKRFFATRGLRAEDTASFPRRRLTMEQLPLPPGETSAAYSAWADKLVIGPAQAANTRAQIQSSFGPKVGVVNSLDRHVARSGSRTMEVLLNAAQGLIAEANLADSGRLVQHARFGYTQRSNGTYLRTSARVEIAPRKGRDVPTVFQYTMTNIVTQ